MKTYFKKKYGMSDQGVNDLLKSIFSSTLFNIAIMFPMFISFIFIKQYSDKLFGNLNSTAFSFWQYLLVITIAAILMYVIAFYDYGNTFTKIYDESAKSRINLAEKLRHLPLSYFSKKDIADLSATIMSDATTYEHLFSHTVPKVYAGTISIIIMAVMLFVFDYRLAIALFWVVPLAFLIFFASKKKNQQILREGFGINREIIDDFQEGIQLVQEIKAYNREEDFIAEINKKYDREWDNKIQSEVVMGSMINIAFILLKLGMATVAIYGTKLYVSGELEVFTYLAFIIVSAFVFNPIISAMINMAEMLYLDSIVERIREINRMPIQEGSKEFNPQSYDIVFEQVHFSYDDESTVLKNVSFQAKQGEVTALVGPSGSGKTTATKLAARFWDIDSGKITVGSVDIAQIDPETLLQHFSIVFQDVSLFNDTIMENIRLGRRGATDEEVKRVAKIARCDDFVQHLPEGYNTLIGENGEKLSGGERQRISIARALLKDAPIILLDESTASLDAENESKIQSGLSELIKDKTVIIIAHRMRTVIDADKIVVLKDGEIAEIGQSETLLKQNGIFAQMYQSQLSVN